MVYCDKAAPITFGENKTLFLQSIRKRGFGIGYRPSFLNAQHKEQKELKFQQAVEMNTEQTRQNARLRTGFMGLVDRVTGKRKRTISENFVDRDKSNKQRQIEQITLGNNQKNIRKTIQVEASCQKSWHAAVSDELNKDIRRLEIFAKDEREITRLEEQRSSNYLKMEIWPSLPPN